MGLTKIHYGLSAHTHAGTLGVFGMNFVKTGKIDKELGAFFSRMEQLRMKAEIGRASCRERV